MVKKTDEQFKNVSKNQQNEHHILALFCQLRHSESGGFISFLASSYKYFSAFSLVGLRLLRMHRRHAVLHTPVVHAEKKCVALPV